MLKKITSSELMLGMYVERLGRSWLDTPFWTRSFLLESPADLERIRSARLCEVWIDTTRGQAPQVAPPAVPSAAPPAAAGAPAAAPATVPASKTVADPGPPRSREEELARARRQIERSRQAVQTMFDEVRMGKALSAAQAYELVDDIAASMQRGGDVLLGLARLKSADNYTYMHSVAVCALMTALARELGLAPEQVRSAGLAGLLHDIGKMAVPSAILNKPGSLSEAEFSSVRAHPAAGHRMLQEVGEIDPVALDVCLHHHEKLDGSGYPKGLRGEEISLFARMGAICDVYDAITSNRPYKQGWCPADSLRRMAGWRGGHLDAQLFAAFVKCLGIYPLGTLVRLQSERLAVVVGQSPGKPLTQPTVRVFFSIRAGTCIAPTLLDLAAPGCQERIVSTESAAQWRLQDIDRYWAGEPAVA
ncbi:cyclic di-GMP phosphodiesterase response regulator RpfG [Janthinobacterium sp. HH103]|uniref:HD-GYP domain-containing protein n=1 Tax=unclassified Janthinobacterium TaxID=2610881 RepID=UPI0008742305|nr:MULTISPECIES: HD-GYP domain-containing protein [unclassified Janthinobacterium]OEZ63487.1 cyclic di-GMP phosphodiesterase response regulator RpfG [Janthinobacterium sp. HH100]OEZ80785.1 cyclic di-GMP phosphodiesterase response regulator RpfG [Janthinobacterium sp. HH103]OEZ95706.1 cyclic di-GMP phosphodiesterase response regulator RpfG [Janthinobacterium sp. HH107]QOU72754.1 Cyclic di-GMP phosphodiesterase [Janthinobacterium sp. HH102]